MEKFLSATQFGSEEEMNSQDSQSERAVDSINT